MFLPVMSIVTGSLGILLPECLPPGSGGRTRLRVRGSMRPTGFWPATSPGWGLAVSKQLVEGHGGSIEVESEVGKDCTFTVILPTKEAIA